MWHKALRDVCASAALVAFILWFAVQAAVLLAPTPAEADEDPDFYESPEYDALCPQRANRALPPVPHASPPDGTIAVRPMLTPARRADAFPYSIAEDR